MEDFWNLDPDPYINSNGSASLRSDSGNESDGYNYTVSLLENVYLIPFVFRWRSSMEKWAGCGNQRPSVTSVPPVDSP